MKTVCIWEAYLILHVYITLSTYCIPSNTMCISLCILLTFLHVCVSLYMCAYQNERLTTKHATHWIICYKVSFSSANVQQNRRYFALITSCRICERLADSNWIKIRSITKCVSLCKEVNALCNLQAQYVHCVVYSQDKGQGLSDTWFCPRQPPGIKGLER